MEMMIKDFMHSQGWDVSKGGKAGGPRADAGLRNPDKKQKGPREEWECLACGETNFMTRKSCRHCAVGREGYARALRAHAAAAGPGRVAFAPGVAPPPGGGPRPAPAPPAGPAAGHAAPAPPAAAARPRGLEVLREKSHCRQNSVPRRCPAVEQAP